MGHVISESCYKRTILQRNYTKMTILWSFSYNSFVKIHGKKNWDHNITALYPKWCYIKRYVIKGLHCIYGIYPLYS